MSQFLSSAPAIYSEILCNRYVQIIKSASDQYLRANVLLAITHKDQIDNLRTALSSAFSQTLIKQKRARILIIDDQSSSPLQESLSKYIQHPSVTLISTECGSPARSRNLALDWADSQFDIQWVARLDADDELYTDNSLESLWQSVCNTDNVAAIGSNKLKLDGHLLQDTNVADANELLIPSNLAGLIENFAEGRQQRELPSCNLILKTKLGLRYPNIRSAEDHWLVCRLLMQFPGKVAVSPFPYYSIYTLAGTDTKANRQSSLWYEQRIRLARVARTWSILIASKRKLLGIGMEGVVWSQHGRVIKEFYPWAMSDLEANRLKILLKNSSLPFPSVDWRKCEGKWQYHTQLTEGKIPGKYIPTKLILNFLCSLYNSGVSALNIKRDNLLITPDRKLTYIDIGKDIQQLTTSNFRDMCARLYSIGVLGNSDEEYVRRHSWRNETDDLNQMRGFSDFYKDIITSLNPECETNPLTLPISTSTKFHNSQITLLIKACSQDAEVFSEQVSHIITHLNYPVFFAKKVILIDSHRDHFLRQYAKPDYKSLLSQAKNMKNLGMIDEILISPTEKAPILEIYKQWFGEQQVTHTHTVKNAPLFPQIWAFEQINTRYVLQCDLDVLIGRRDWGHDYLADMIYACEPEDVLCVGFNISKASPDFNPYHGEPGQFAPEVRLGLLDLCRIRKQLPISNPVESGHFVLTWHRALQKAMRASGLRAVRGGDLKTFYVHPNNADKDQAHLSLSRDLISQGKEPVEQKEKFDWQPIGEWQYPPRSEQLVFLLKGRMTEYDILNRCLKSLRLQDNQSFGIILIDDASGATHNWCYPLILGDLLERTTLIRHNNHQGRMANFLLAIKSICTDPGSMIAILDQDDCLMKNNIASLLLKAKAQGADLIQMPMFRPNKPLKQYKPDYKNPRHCGGGNVWSHMRAFTKALFESVPEDHFKRAKTGEWFETVTDYLTMIPMVELAQKPMYLDSGYAYWHLRKEYKHKQKVIEITLIEEILAKPSLIDSDKDVVVPRPECDEV